MKEIILASQSPRRKELLEEVGLRFRVEPAQIEEHLDESLPITQAIEQLAKEKAMPIARRNPQCIVIGADTLVAVDGLVLGKPADEADAARMLRMLSGRRHQVIGGVALLCGNAEVLFHCVSEVRFFPLREEEIAAYIRSGEPMDKAGAYGIQGLGALLVEGIEGDYGNVVGLPLCRLGEMLSRFGVDLLSQNAQKERAL